MDDRDQPVPVPPKIEDHKSIHEIGILEPAMDFSEVVPPDGLNDSHPCLDFVRRIRVLPHGFAQVPPGDDMHFNTILHNL
jgi:hypothetical protein